MKRLPYYYPLVLWVLLIFTTSCFFIPLRTFLHMIQALPFGAAVADFWRRHWFLIVKGWHATEYAILTVIGAKVIRRRHEHLGMAAVWISFAFAVLFAASDEWHQTFVPDRDGCLRDVLIDTGGALVAALFLSVHEWTVRRKPLDRRPA
jgi:VanZ family protein